MGVTAKATTEFDSSGLDLIWKKLRDLDGSGVDYGFYDNQTHEESGLPMSDLALIMERGSDKHNIPARPFMAHSGIYFSLSKMNILKLAFNRYMTGKADKLSLLGRIGLSAKQQIKDTISYQNFVALKPDTIARKGFSTILIESGELEKSCQVVIRP